MMHTLAAFIGYQGSKVLLLIAPTAKLAIEFQLSASF